MTANTVEARWRQGAQGREGAVGACYMRGSSFLGASPLGQMAVYAPRPSPAWGQRPPRRAWAGARDWSNAGRSVPGVELVNDLRISIAS